MKEDRPTRKEPAGDRLAAFLRDCLLGAIVVAMIGWLTYVGIAAIAAAHLDFTHSGRLHHRWFYRPLNGLAARLAGLSFLCLAAAFTSLGMSHPAISRRVPAWMRSSCWWFLAGWAALYITASIISESR